MAKQGCITRYHVTRPPTNTESKRARTNTGETLTCQRVTSDKLADMATALVVLLAASAFSCLSSLTEAAIYPPFSCDSLVEMSIPKMQQLFHRNALDFTTLTFCYIKRIRAYSNPNTFDSRLVSCLLFGVGAWKSISDNCLLIPDTICSQCHY